MCIRKFYASALLVDNKILFWKVSPNKKEQPFDFYKDFYCAGINMTAYLNTHNCKVVNQEFVQNEDISNNDIFHRLAPTWFRQFSIHEDSRGQLPYLKPTDGEEGV